MDPDTREELRHLLSTSGTMAGLCITATTLFATLRTIAAKTVVDDIFVVSALLFCYAPIAYSGPCAPTTSPRYTC